MNVALPWIWAVEGFAWSTNKNKWSTTSEVAVFRVRLSGIVASELLLRDPGDGADEGKGAGLQGTEFFGNAYDFIQPIIGQQNFPITDLPIFQHPLDNIGSMPGKVDMISINIPKDAV